MERQIGIGLVLTIATVALLGFYFVYEPTLQQQQAQRFQRRALETGAYLYSKYCILCHGNQGQGVQGLGLALKNTQLEKDVLYKIIARGRPIALSTQDPKPLRDMPAWSREEGGPLNKDEIEDIILFLKNWDQESQDKALAKLEAAQAAAVPSPEPGAAPKIPPGADPAKGQRIFTQQSCFACHGQKGEGGLGGLAPKITRTALTLEEVRSQLRNPRSQMPPFDARTLPDKDIEHIYAWLQTLR